MMADTDRTVVGGTALAPSLDECTGAALEAVAAVGVADLEGGTFYRFAFGAQQMDSLAVFTFIWMDRPLPGFPW